MGLSPLQQLKAHPDRARIIQQMPPGLVHAVARGDWEITARPEQLPPPGDWLIHLLLAGRGFGKSRTANEWIVGEAADNPNTRWAAVAATWSDMRDVMFEGPAGIVAVAQRRGIEYTWNRTNGEFRLRNGARIQGFSAEKPDRLRGPQFHGAICVAAGTLVATPGGEKRIEDIRAGDHVLGEGARGPVWARVSRAARTGVGVETVRVSAGGASVDLTREHLVWTTTRGWVESAGVSVTDTLLVCGQMTSNQETPPAGTSGTGNAGTSERNAPTITRTGKASYSTENCGSTTTDQSQMAWSFTIKTETATTTPPGTSSSWRVTLTARTTAPRYLSGLSDKLLRCARRHLKRRGRNGKRTRDDSNARSVGTISIRRIHAEQPTAPKSAGGRRGSTPLSQGNTSQLRGNESSLRTARSAGTSSRPQPAVPSIAVRRVGSGTAGKNLLRRGRRLSASIAASSSGRNGATLSRVLLSAAPHTVTRRTVVNDTNSDVYDLTTDTGNFYAGRILVHNCDEWCSWRYQESWSNLRLGLRLGRLPRVVITTTPRPIPELRVLLKDPGVVVTRGATHDNADNLSAAALEELERIYGGTRLGRQELLGEVLDETEGALWSHTLFDKGRVEQTPERVARRVVGVDPAVTVSESSDETGIIIASVTDDGHVYIEADLSGKYAPDVWARKIASLDVDSVIVEVNQGGDLVRQVMTAAGVDVKIRPATAVRGKQARAEPIAVLYERGLVHHVGTFPELEDQAAAWVPGAGKSPDRVDALVWAVSALTQRQPGRAVSFRT